MPAFNKQAKTGNAYSDSHDEQPEWFVKKADLFQGRPAGWACHEYDGGVPGDEKADLGESDSVPDNLVIKGRAGFDVFCRKLRVADSQSVVLLICKRVAGVQCIAKRMMVTEAAVKIEIGPIRVHFHAIACVGLLLCGRVFGKKMRTQKSGQRADQSFSTITVGSDKNAESKFWHHHQAGYKAGKIPAMTDTRDTPRQRIFKQAIPDGRQVRGGIFRQWGIYFLHSFQPQNSGVIQLASIQDRPHETGYILGCGG